MLGRIMSVNDTKNIGFIAGEDNNKYFFRVSEVICMSLPTINSIVEFIPGENERGKMAKEIHIKELAQPKPEFIRIGNDRIKISNIRDYYYGTYYKPQEGLYDYSLIETHGLRISTYQDMEYNFDSKTYGRYELENKLKLLDELLC